MDKTIKIIATGLSISTVFLYFVGVSLWNSILNEWGIPSSIFPQSIEEHITYGYDMLIIIFSTQFITVFLSLAGIIILSDVLHSKFPNMLSMKENNKNYTIMRLLRNYSTGFLISIFLIIAPFVIVYGPMQNKAKKYLIDKSLKSVSTIITESKNIEHIKIIVMNSNYCAYYDGNHTNIINSDDIVKIISEIAK